MRILTNISSSSKVILFCEQPCLVPEVNISSSYALFQNITSPIILDTCLVFGTWFYKQGRHTPAYNRSLIN